MKIVVIFAGITHGHSTSSVFKSKGKRNFLHCWPDHKRLIIDPLIAAGHHVSVRVSTYAFEDEKFKNKFLEIVKPERVVIANFWGSSARTTKVNSFQLFDPNEQVDFVIWSRADNHMHVKVTDMNINYSKFNFMFKERAHEEGGTDWWEQAKFTPDCLWMWPGAMTPLVYKSLIESFNWNNEDHSTEDPYHRVRSDSHNFYNYLVKNVPSNAIHFVEDAKYSAAKGNPFFRHCWDDLSEFSF